MMDFATVAPKESGYKTIDFSVSGSLETAPTKVLHFAARLQGSVLSPTLAMVAPHGFRQSILLRVVGAEMDPVWVLHGAVRLQGSAAITRRSVPLISRRPGPES